MKYQNIVIITLLALMTSCSSDPCESINCVNGNCIDGTCQCEEGYVGALCDQLPCVNGASVNGKCQCDPGSFGVLCDITSITGLYYPTAFVMSDCPSYVTQYDISADVSDAQVCGISESGNPICFVHSLLLEEDGDYFWSRGINIEREDGTIENTFFEFQRGTFIAQDALITTTSDKGDIRTLNIQKDKVIWERRVADGGVDCIWTEEYTLSQ